MKKILSLNEHMISELTAIRIAMEKRNMIDEQRRKGTIQIVRRNYLLSTRHQVEVSFILDSIDWDEIESSTEWLCIKKQLDELQLKYN